MQVNLVSCGLNFGYIFKLLRALYFFVGIKKVKLLKNDV